MPSRLWRSANRSGWRGLVLLALMPAAFASLDTALLAHGTVRAVAYAVYCATAAVVVVLAWQISFGRHDA